MRNRFAVTALVALALCACGGSGGPPEAASLKGTTVVSAASSLTDSFRALGGYFEAAHSGVTVELNFGGSPTLVTQIENGFSADVFASADTTNMDRLNGDGLTAGTSQVFAHNKLE